MLARCGRHSLVFASPQFLCRWYSITSINSTVTLARFAASRHQVRLREAGRTPRRTWMCRSWHREVNCVIIDYSVTSLYRWPIFTFALTIVSSFRVYTCINHSLCISSVPANLGEQREDCNLTVCYAMKPIPSTQTVDYSVMSFYWSVP